MKKKENKFLSFLKNNYKTFIKYIIIIIVGIVAGAGIDVAIRPTEDGNIVIDASFSMRLSPEQQDAIITTESGEEIVDENIVTIEEIDSNQLLECPDGIECGQGKYIYAPTESYSEFKDYSLNNCFDVDGYYGSQCWDLAATFWMNYTEDGRTLSTCGTGAAKGSWNCKEQNAGNEFELIYDVNDIQAGDWIIFASGEYGHVGMALGNNNNGYVTLLGTNQGGYSCAGGGSAANIINISLKSFIGAFRPKTYINAEEPEENSKEVCKTWEVEVGDTLGKIMKECEGKIEWGEKMNEYAKTWYSTIYAKGQSVYEGWNSLNGVGLYAGDVIERKQ